MKVVNTEKLLQDYEILAAEKAANLADIRQQALAFANTRKYNAERAEAFIAYVAETENGGLSEEQKTLFDVLGKYIEEVEPEAEAGNGEVVD